jgi:flagellar biosynthetic protein FliP
MSTDRSTGDRAATAATAPTPVRPTARPTVGEALRDRAFVVHYLQMLVAMIVGMVVLMPVSMLVGDLGIEVDSLLMATWMTIGMAAWMVWRRHSAASVLEMSLAMYLSFAVLFPPYWLGVLPAGAVMAVGHVLMLPAMAVAMLRRREEYCAHH